MPQAHYRMEDEEEDRARLMFEEEMRNSSMDSSSDLLAIAIPTLVPLVFLLSLSCPCLCYDEIKPEHAHNRHTRGGWRESM